MAFNGDIGQPPDRLAVGRRLLAQMGYTGGGLGRHCDGRETPYIPQPRPVGLGLGSVRSRQRSPPPSSSRKRSASPLSTGPAGDDGKKKRKTKQLKLQRKAERRRQQRHLLDAGDKIATPATADALSLLFECAKCALRLPTKRSLKKHTRKCPMELCLLCGRSTRDVESHTLEAHSVPPEIVAIKGRRESRNEVCSCVEMQIYVALFDS